MDRLEMIRTIGETLMSDEELLNYDNSTDTEANELFIQFLFDKEPNSAILESE